MLSTPGLFLMRGTTIDRRLAALAPWVCVSVHAVALVMLAVFLKPGTLVEADPTSRAHYIASHVVAWTIGWSMWILSAVSLVGFYAWWRSRLTPKQTLSPAQNRFRSNLATFAVVITAIGMLCDLSGEGALMLLLVERIPKLPAGSNPAADLASFTKIERAFTLLSAGAANGLYTLGGILLTLITPDLPRWIRVAMWVTWAAGIGMTLAALANNTAGMVLSTAVLFPPFLVWVAWMGARWPGMSSAQRRRA